MDDDWDDLDDADVDECIMKASQLYPSIKDDKTGVKKSNVNEKKVKLNQPSTSNKVDDDFAAFMDDDFDNFDDVILMSQLPNESGIIQKKEMTSNSNLDFLIPPLPSISTKVNNKAASSSKNQRYPHNSTFVDNVDKNRSGVTPSQFAPFDDFSCIDYEEDMETDNLVDMNLKKKLNESQRNLEEIQTEMTTRKGEVSDHQNTMKIVRKKCVLFFHMFKQLKKKM